MRRSSLDTIDVGIDRELSSQFDAVKLVAGSLDTVEVVATSVDDVNTVSQNITSVITSSNNIADINVVAADLSLAGVSLIETVSNNIDEVVLVGNSINAVGINAINIVAINTNANNIIDIQNASENAASALSAANIATIKAGEASSSAITASTQAGIATTKAGEASASAASALVSQNAADASEANALASASAAAVKANEALVSANAAITQAEIATIKAVEASESSANALISENGALSSKNSAAISATTATTKAAEAVVSASSAAGSASVATTKANEASLSADNALASENKAEKWADEAEDVEVEAGKYSAKHWALKAEEFSSGTASNIAYDNVTSGLTATNLQDALDEIVDEINTPVGTVGTYRSVTTDAQGRVISGTNPTTVAGYGITDVYTKAQTDSNINVAVTGLVNGSPAALDTLNELAAALGNDANFATTVSTSIGTKVTKNVDIVGGTSTKITYDAKGLVTGGTSLAAVDIPALDWSKITTGKPTTLSGYGISDAQPQLVSGTNIKTINGQSVLGSGDIAISGAGAGDMSKSVYDTNNNGKVDNAENADTVNGLTVETAVPTGALFTDTVTPLNDTLVSTSTTEALTANQGKVLKDLVDTKQDILVSGTNIKTINGDSLLGSGDVVIDTLDKLPLSGGVMTGAITAIRETKVAMTTNNINLATGNLFTKTITDNTTITVSNVPTSGTVQSFILELTNGGAYIITWFSNTKWAGGIAPTLTVSGVDILGFYSYDGGATWKGIVMSKDSK